MTNSAAGRLRNFWDGDVAHSFRSSPVAMTAAVIAFVCVFCAVFAGYVAPYNPFDLATLELGDARIPPAWMQGGSTKYLLGTDSQGRDILSALMYGARISLAVGLASVVLSMLIGVTLGLFAGFYGGWIDSFLMRTCDVMLSFPAILVALLIAGVARALFPQAQTSLAFGVLIDHIRRRCRDHVAFAGPHQSQTSRADIARHLRSQDRHSRDPGFAQGVLGARHVLRARMDSGQPYGVHGHHPRGGP